MILNGPAAARIFDEHVDAIFGYVARRLGPGRALPIVREVFELGFRDAAADQPRAHLLGVATEQIARHADDEHRHLTTWTQPADRPASALDVSDPLFPIRPEARVAQHAAALRAVADFEPAQRDVLLLAVWEQCRPSLIASALGVGLGEVRSRLGRARRDLRTAQLGSNPLGVLEAAAPTVGPIPAFERARLREHLFELAADPRVSANTTPPPPRPARPAARLLAVAGLGIVALAGLAFAGSRANDPAGGAGRADSDPIPAPTAAPNTAAPTIQATTGPTSSTTTPAVAGSPTTPLLFPAERTRLNAVSHTKRSLGGSSALFRAPDLTTIAISERDGVRDDGREPARQIGSVEITTPESEDSHVYGIRLPCGSAWISDDVGAERFRPSVDELIRSISITDGIIDISLPAGWDLIDHGNSADRFELGIPVEADGEQHPVSFVQYPNGSIAVAGSSGRQFEPTTFRGQVAWLSRHPENPDDIEIVGMLGSTAFSLSSEGLTLRQLEVFVDSLVPGDALEWIARYGRLDSQPDLDIRACTQQPEFNIARA